jgi:prepilin-type N-terminal cleavage/methylation domain-containing protein
MFTLKKRDQAGFTIVELLIVIVVIGILAALVVTTYGGIQSKARDSKRQTDIQTIQTQIEAFYANKNYYPSLAEINSATWRSTNMKSLDAGALTDPSAAAGTVLSGNAASATAKNVYGYEAKNDAGQACAGTPTTPDETCTKYTLTAYQESSKTVLTKTQLN